MIADAGMNAPQNESNMKFETTKNWCIRWNKSIVIDENVENIRCFIVANGREKKM